MLHRSRSCDPLLPPIPSGFGYSGFAALWRVIAAHSGYFKGSSPCTENIFSIPHICCKTATRNFHAATAIIIETYTARSGQCALRCKIAGFCTKIADKCQNGQVKMDRSIRTKWQIDNRPPPLRPPDPAPPYPLTIVAQLLPHYIPTNYYSICTH